MAPLKTLSGDVSSDSTVKAELLNDYFSSTFQIDNNAIPNCPPPLPTLSFEPRFTIAKVKTLMRKLNSKIAGGPDDFHPIFFKNCNESLSKPLAYLFSLSYVHSFLPTSWRHPYITSIFKKGDSSCVAIIANFSNIYCLQNYGIYN